MSSSNGAEWRDRSRRAELQRMLGELGVVLARQRRGTLERPAAGWYARLVDGELVFLGDHSEIGLERIEQLKAGGVRQASAPAPGRFSWCTSSSVVPAPSASRAQLTPTRPAQLLELGGTKGASAGDDVVDAGQLPGARRGRGRPRKRLPPAMRHELARMHREGKSARLIAIRLDVSRRQVAAELGAIGVGAQVARKSCPSGAA